MITIDTHIVRYGELRPCKSAFIDTHTPGSDKKENFTIIGSGVSESQDQHVHIRETPGFHIGAAGQPPKCRNSLHSHRTAEVFFVLSQRWRFFWGRWGNAGEVTLEKGDIFNIPTGIFRGFENIGIDYGMIMAILGGDDAGGGVIWAPQVIEEATKHGLLLAETGVLYDHNKGEKLPDNVNPMPLLNETQLQNFPELPASKVIPKCIARYQDLLAMSHNQPIKVIGESALLYDRPGFEIDFVSQHSFDSVTYTTPRHEILIPVVGHWKIVFDNQQAILNPGDTCAVPPQISRTIMPSMSGESSMYRIRNTDDPAGASRMFHTTE